MVIVRLMVAAEQGTVHGHYTWLLVGTTPGG